MQRCLYGVNSSGCRWGARQSSNALDIRRMVRKHDCALAAQYTKHSNAQSIRVRLRVRVRVRVRVRDRSIG